MASAGSETISGTGKVVYQDPKGCTSFAVTCLDTGAQRALVHVDSLHDAGDWFVVEKGQTILFRLFHCGIRKVTIKGDGGNTAVNYGVVSKTVRI